MNHRRTLPHIVVALLLLAPHARADYAAPELLFNFQDLFIAESSGVASSSRWDDVLYTHNDSGDVARFFAVGPAGETLSDTFVVGRASDWEDMARGPGSGGASALYFGDIGDNESTRLSIMVYEVPEPEILLRFGAAVPSSIRLLQYEDGPHNAETLLADPADGTLYIVTKDESGRSGLYRAEGGVMRRAAEIRFEELGATNLFTTGGDISPRRDRLVVRTYAEAFEWTIAPGESIASAVGRPPARIPLAPTTRGGEAISYTRDGSSLVTTTEGRFTPVHLYRAL